MVISSIRREQLRRNQNSWYKRNPWFRAYERAKRRCTDPKIRNWASYGGRGIKFRLHVSACIMLWYRDMAFLMHTPTLDRINSDGHYELRNCRFREYLENKEDRRKPYTAPEVTEWTD